MSRQKLLIISLVFACPVFAQLPVEGFIDSANYYKSTDQQKAFVLLEKAADVLKSDNDRTEDYARTCFELGTIASELKRDSTALTYLTIAADLLSANKSNLALLSSCYNALGIIHERLGDKNISAESYLKALATRAEVYGKNSVPFANTAYNLGLLFFNYEEYHKADSFLSVAGKIYLDSLGRFHKNYFDVMESLGRVNWYQDSNIKAIPFLLEAATIADSLEGKNSKTYTTILTRLGRVYTDAALYADAERSFLISKSILEKTIGKENEDYAYALHYLGVAYILMERFADAEEQFTASARIKRNLFGAFDEDYAKTMLSLSEMYISRNEFPKAQMILEAIKGERQSVPEKTETDIGITQKLSLVYKELDQPLKTEAALVEYKNLNKKIYGENSSHHAFACSSLGSFYITQLNYEQAVPYFQFSKNYFHLAYGSDNVNYGVACVNLAISYSELSKHDSAGILYMEGLRTFEIKYGVNSEQYGATVGNLAIYFSDIGDFQKAKHYYEKALENRRTLHGVQSELYASLCNNLGTLYYDMGLFEEALKYYREAKEIKEKLLGKAHVDYAISCMNIGNALQETGDLQQAERIMEESRLVLENTAGKRHRYYGIILNNLGNLYTEMGQLRKAERCYLEAKEIKAVNPGRSHIEYANACENLASHFLLLKQHKEAETLFKEAKEIRIKNFGTDHTSVAISFTNLGRLYMETGNYTQAEEYLREGYRIRRNNLGNMHPEYATSCMELGDYYLLVKNFNASQAFYQEANKIFREVFGVNHSLYSSTLQNLAIVNWKLGQQSLADSLFTESFSIKNEHLKRIFQFTSESEKIAYLETNSKNYSPDYTYFSSTRNASAALTISLHSRNLVLNATQALKKLVYASGDSTLVKHYQNLMNLKRSLATFYTRNTPGASTAVLEDSANALEKLLYASINYSGSTTEEDLITKLQSKLKTGEAIIDFIEFNEFTEKVTDSMQLMAIIIKPGHPPALVKLGSLVNQLSSVSKEKDLTRSSRQPTAGAFNLVSEKIWKPLEDHLDGVKHIYYSPSGILYNVSFAAIRLDSQNYVSDKYHLTRLSSAAGIFLNAKDDRLTLNDEIQLFGGVQYYSNKPSAKTEGEVWQYLPGTFAEVEQINLLADGFPYKIRVNTGDMATEDNLKSLEGNASPAVIHIATHGFFSPAVSATADPKNYMNPFMFSNNSLIRSGLILKGGGTTWSGKQIEGKEDGILTAYEVSSLNFPNTRLAVLSACETALGEIRGTEGVYGLQRAFKLAGVQNILMSLWPVPDKETAEFMTEFYKTLFKGKGIAQSFHETQNALKAKYRSDPRKWAAWVLIQ